MVNYLATVISTFICSTFVTEDGMILETQNKKSGGVCRRKTVYFYHFERRRRISADVKKLIEIQICIKTKKADKEVCCG